MFSEEKVNHIVHLLLDGLWKADMVEYPDEEQTTREAKKILWNTVSQMTNLGETVRKRIQSQKNPPPENSPQWDVLYQKYYEEELRKHGG